MCIFMPCTQFLHVVRYTFCYCHNGQGLRTSFHLKCIIIMPKVLLLCLYFYWCLFQRFCCRQTTIIIDYVCNENLCKSIDTYVFND